MRSSPRQYRRQSTVSQTVACLFLLERNAGTQGKRGHRPYHIGCVTAFACRQRMLAARLPLAAIGWHPAQACSTVLKIPIHDVRNGIRNTRPTCLRAFGTIESGQREESSGCGSATQFPASTLSSNVSRDLTGWFCCICACSRLFLANYLARSAWLWHSSKRTLHCRQVRPEGGYNSWHLGDSSVDL